MLIYFARRVMDAECALDLTAETFAQALECRSQFRGHTSEQEQGWLFAIARHQLAHFCYRGVVERDAVARLDIPRPTLTIAEIERIEELAEVTQLAPRLMDAMQTLPDDQRNAVQLRVVKEMGYQELASYLGVTEQVARKRVSRGLRALALRLNQPEAILGGAT